MQKKRQANFECLRIVAILMIIILHYLSKSNLDVKLTQDAGLQNHLLWLLRAVCISAVNVYVLISGYFFADSKWNIKKLIYLVLEVWFYSVLVALVLVATGIVPVDTLTVYDWINVVLPLQTEHYWFATAYIILYMLAPVLMAAVNHLSQKELRLVILLLTGFFAIPKSIVPLFLATDKYGYDFGWFICLFLIAAYYRKYGISFLDKCKHPVLLNIASVLCVFIYGAILALLTRKIGKFEYAMDMVYAYNHILVLFASITLFAAWKKITIPQGKVSALICRLAPCSFGVYLLHEHFMIRDRWTTWLSVEMPTNGFERVLHLIICVLLVYAVGTVVDLIRGLLFKGLKG